MIFSLASFSWTCREEDGGVSAASYYSTERKPPPTKQKASKMLTRRIKKCFFARELNSNCQQGWVRPERGNNNDDKCLHGRHRNDVAVDQNKITWVWNEEAVTSPLEWGHEANKVLNLFLSSLLNHRRFFFFFEFFIFLFLQRQLTKQKKKPYECSTDRLDEPPPYIRTAAINWSATKCKMNCFSCQVSEKVVNYSHRQYWANYLTAA